MVVTDEIGWVVMGDDDEEMWWVMMGWMAMRDDE